MADEDFVLETVRSEIRQLRVLAENYKIQQRAVELQYKQVEQAFEILNQPPTPAGPAGGGTRRQAGGGRGQGIDQYGAGAAVDLGHGIPSCLPRAVGGSW